jgi:hypothetical protein
VLTFDIFFCLHLLLQNEAAKHIRSKVNPTTSNIQCRPFVSCSYSVEGLRYWYRPPSKPHGLDLQPKFFIHGLGIGVTPYLPFVAALMADRRRASVVVELGHIAMRLNRRPPTLDQTVSHAAALYLRSGTSKKEGQLCFYTDEAQQRKRIVEQVVSGIHQVSCFVAFKRLSLGPLRAIEY